MTRILKILWCVALVGLAAPVANANCPFCSAAGQTLRQEMQTMDVVGIATLVSDGRKDIDGAAKFKIEVVLKGESLVKAGQEFQATYFGPGTSKKRFLMQGVDPRELVWSSPIALSEEGEKYISKLLKLPEDPVERLAFFQEYFEHPDTLLARDCYDEFALSPYEDVIKLKARMKREKLISWVQDPSMAPDRKRLYYTMLGVCGIPEDTQWMEKLIKSSKAEDRTGLDSLLAAYLNLKGEAGLPLVVDSFLKNPDSQYVDIFAAVMALRFHSSEGKILKQASVAKAMSQLLDRPDLADLVIPDLARMEDWSQLDRLTQLFRDAKEDNAWIRMPIVNYTRACPLPEAKERLQEMEKIDPAAVKRSKTFFPIPVPSPQKKSDTSSSLRRHRNELLADHSDSLQTRRTYRRSLRIASLGDTIPYQYEETGGASGMNQGVVLAVVVLATATLGSIMWTIVTSGASA
jgi:hypothetical protein